MKKGNFLICMPRFKIYYILNKLAIENPIGNFSREKSWKFQLINVTNACSHKHLPEVEEDRHNCVKCGLWGFPSTIYNKIPINFVWKSLETGNAFQTVRFCCHCLYSSL